MKREPRGRPCPCCQGHSHVYRVTHDDLGPILLTTREHHCQDPACGTKWFSYQVDAPNISCPAATDNATVRHP